MHRKEEKLGVSPVLVGVLRQPSGMRLSKRTMLPEERKACRTKPNPNHPTNKQTNNNKPHTQPPQNKEQNKTRELVEKPAKIRMKSTSWF